MTKEDLTLVAGTYIVFSEGQYSDYGYRGHYKVLEDRTDEEVRQVARDILASIKEQGERWYYQQDKFIVELANRGWIEQFPVKEIYIGAYGELGIS